MREELGEEVVYVGYRAWPSVDEGDVHGGESHAMCGTRACVQPQSCEILIHTYMTIYLNKFSAFTCFNTLLYFSTVRSLSNTSLNAVIDY